MKSFVITLKNNQYSEQCAERCIKSAKQYSIVVEKFYGVDKNNAHNVMAQYDLQWTWANNNTQKTICPISGLQQFPYKAADLRSKIGCSMSHYLLWKKCVELQEPILILEHDAVFLRSLPQDINFKGICQINDPLGATRKGLYWSNIMKKRGGCGVFPKTKILEPGENIPDGLAGNSAYMIKPHAAQELIDAYKKYGVWMNDAIMCIKLFPYLEEYYPFITKVQQTQSTSTT